MHLAPLRRLVSVLLLSLPVAVAVAQPVPAVVPPDSFLTRWLVLGPVPVTPGGVADDAAHHAAFAAEPLPVARLAPAEGRSVKLGGRAYTWRTATATGHYVDLDRLFDGEDHAYAYAVADFEAAAAGEVLFGLGSDDAVSVYVDGRPMHRNEVARGHTEDADLVALPLRKGRNRIVVRVHDRDRGWGFSLRRMGPVALGAALHRAAREGDVALLRRLMAAGAPVDAPAGGLTPVQVARLEGRADVVQALLAAGAHDLAPPAPEVLADRYLTEHAADTGAALVLLVAVDGQTRYRAARGLADMGNRVAATPEHRFRIGSITKQFVAAAILKLQEEGRLSVQDRLSTFVPGFPRGDEVTLYHLLTHTSGIHSFTDQPEFLSRVAAAIDEDSLVALIRSYPYDFDPGTHWAYNNSGYVLLGHIIRRVTGKPYGDYLRETFFEPLGMTDTDVHTASAILEREAYGYRWDDGVWSKAVDWDMSWAGGAGSMVSTVDDLARWAHALLGGRVLLDASLGAAFTPVRLADGSAPTGPGSRYGFGWMIGEDHGLRTLSHSGGLHGFSANLVIYPDRKVVVVALQNALPAPGGGPGEATAALARAYLWDVLQARPSQTVAAVDPATFDAYVGRYELPGGVILHITRQGDHLMGRVSGQQAFEIFPRAADVFFWKVVEATTRFERDGAGRVTHLVHTQNGIDTRAARLVEETPVALPAEAFDRVAGTYELAPGQRMTLVREGDRYFGQIGPQKLEVFPRSETEFFLREVAASFTVVVGPDGEPVSLVFRQGPATVEARRVAD